jgi:hypothetical protein
MNKNAMVSFAAIFLLCSQAVKSSTPQEISKKNASKSGEEIVNFQLTNKALALVNHKVVTFRQVQIYQEIKKLISDQKKILNELADKDILGTYLVDYLLYVEAEQFGLAKVSSEELLDELNQISPKLKSSVPVSQLAPIDSEVLEVITIALKSKVFLEFKLSKFDSMVSAKEVENEYKQNRANYSEDRGRAIEEIQKELKQKRSMDQIQQWFLFLKRKYKVQFLK